MNSFSCTALRYAILDGTSWLTETVDVLTMAYPSLALEGTFWAVPQPITSSPPLTLTWDNGIVGPDATYSWTLTGSYTLTVSATNVCGGSGTGSYTVQMLAKWPYTAYLPLLLRSEEQ